MDRRTHIPASELAGVYNSIEFYIKYRYQEIDVEDLKAIRRMLNKIEEDYNSAYTQDPDDFETVRKRKAGRKSTYSAENEKEIVKLHSEGHSLRKIAEETGSTIGRVNAVLKKQRACVKAINTNDRFWDVLDTWMQKDAREKQEDSAWKSGY